MCQVTWGLRLQLESKPESGDAERYTHHVTQKHTCVCHAEGHPPPPPPPAAPSDDPAAAGMEGRASAAAGLALTGGGRGRC